MTARRAPRWRQPRIAGTASRAAASRADPDGGDRRQRDQDDPHLSRPEARHDRIPRRPTRVEDVGDRPDSEVRTATHQIGASSRATERILATRGSLPRRAVRSASGDGPRVGAVVSCRPAADRSSAANSSGGPSRAEIEPPSPADSTSDASTSATRSSRSASGRSRSDVRTAARYAATSAVAAVMRSPPPRSGARTSGCGRSRTTRRATRPARRGRAP